MSGFQEPDLSEVESPPRRNISYDTIRDGTPLGSGGQAIVRRCDLLGPTPQIIAVKEPKTPSDTVGNEVMTAFFEEAQTWKILDTKERQKELYDDSEHIVGVVAIGNELPWIAMEYMDGGSLDERLDNYSTGLPREEALWIGECLSRGIEIAHNYGVAHLDLKPANVLFRETAEDTWAVPKIADWGLSRMLLEQSGSMNVMSVEYAAPEQFKPEQFGDPDTYTDIYQLGSIVYALLTGKPPYTGSQTSVIYDIVHGDDPTPPSAYREDISEAVDAVVLKALKQEKTARYRAITHFNEALRDCRERTTDTTSSSHSQSRIFTHQKSRRVGRQKSSSSPRRKSDGSIQQKSAGAAESDGWPMFQTGPARTSHHPNTIGPEAPVRARWEFQTNGAVDSSPAVVNGTVYVGSRDNTLYALDAESGTTLWTVETDGAVDSSPAVADGTVYVGSQDTTLYALDAESGTKQWTVETDGAVDSSPAVVDGVVYFGSRDNTLYALDAESGTEQWTVQKKREIQKWSSPAVVNSTLYITGRSTIHALDIRDGSKEWQFDIGRSASTPAVSGETVYVGAGDDHVYALNAEDGSKQWAFQTGWSVESSPAVVAGTIYVGSRDNHVYALNAEDGSKQWTFQTRTTVLSSPAVTDGTVYIGSKDRNVYALDAEDGSKQWDFWTGDWVVSSPAVVDGTVYIGSQDNSVYALAKK